MLALPFLLHTCVCMCVCLFACVWLCVCVCVCVCVHTLAWYMQCRSVPCSYGSCHCISLSSYLFVFVFSFSLPLSVLLFFFFFSLYLLAVLLALVPMPRPPLWHHGWLCPIQSATGEGGEWDAGSSESGAGSHHTVLRPWNVSGTTTTTINRAASLSPLLFAAWELSQWNKSTPARSKFSTNQSLKTVSSLMNLFFFFFLIYIELLVLQFQILHVLLLIIFSGCVELLLFRFRLGHGVVHQRNHC